MSIPTGNDATGASGTGPALGYTLNLFWFNFLFMLISKNNMNTCTYLIHTLSLIYAMKLLVIFGIKIYRKLPSYLTIQKPNLVNRLSVSSFAATIKPPPFDGSNYKCWQERLILWLTILRVIHVKEDKPKQFTPEEESAFDEADTLFRGLVISFLSENLVDSYVRLPTGKALWDAVEAQYEVSDTDNELYTME